ncbi:hypothetical protein GGR54DRAFT_647944 [Hypoxylon sp. NC1633]|nr:hypothetical protein GGR54DRAFT_647944 [Hypoxylon sp. NC1633]
MSVRDAYPQGQDPRRDMNAYWARQNREHPTLRHGVTMGYGTDGGNVLLYLYQMPREQQHIDAMKVLVATLGFGLALLARTAYAQDPYYEHDFDGSLWEEGWEGNRGGSIGQDGSSSSGDTGSGNGNGYSSGFGSSAGFSGFPTFDITQASRQRTAHGVLAALCFVVLFPVGAILMRMVSGRHAWILHATTQCVAFALYIAAAGLGLHLIDVVRIPPGNTSLLENPSTNAHPIIGIVILVALFLQPILGIYHHRQFKRLKRRTVFSHAHLWLGRLMVTLGVVNGGLGLQLAGASRDAVTAYSVVAAVAWLIWLVTAVTWEVRQHRDRRQNRRTNNGNNNGTNNNSRNGNSNGDGSGSNSEVHRLHPSRADDGFGVGADGYAAHEHDLDYDYTYLPPGVAPPRPPPTRYNPLHRYVATAEDPSPPYSPGPGAAAGMRGGPPGYTGAVEGEDVEMRPVKGVLGDE